MKLVTKIKITIFLFIAFLIVYGYFYPSQVEKIVYKTCDLVFQKNDTINSEISLKECKNDSIISINDTLSVIQPLKYGDKVKEDEEKVIKIPLQKDESGLFYIISKINDVPIKFILDTGCSNISISQRDIDFLLSHGFISLKDENGTAISIYANGESETTQLYNIKELTFSDDIKLNNLSCTVSPNNDAPALLGQEALQMLGKITIDYNTNELIINK